MKRDALLTRVAVFFCFLLFNVSTNGEDAGELRMAIIARHNQEEKILGRGLRAKFHVVRPGWNIIYDMNFHAVKWKWTADLVYEKSDRFPTGELMAKFANNGFEFTAFSKSTGQGVIADPAVVAFQSGSLDGFGTHLPTEYWLTMRGELISKILDDAGSGVKLLSNDDPVGPDDVFLKVPFGPPGPHHFKFRMNRKHNYAIEESWWYSDEGKVYERAEVRTINELVPGAWIPTEWLVGSPREGTTRGFAHPPDEYTSSDLHCDVAIDPAVFRVEFPDGTLVGNNITGEGYQAGAAPGNSQIDRALWDKARGVATSNDPSRNRFGLWLFIGNGTLLVFLLLYLRRRRREVLK